MKRRAKGKKSGIKRFLSGIMVCALAAGLITFSGTGLTALADETDEETLTYTYEGTTFTYEVSDEEATITGTTDEDCGSVTFPEEIDGVTVTAVGASAFNGCDTLTYVVMADTITSIGNNAFKDCTALTGIEFSDSLKSIGRYAFYDCQSLTEVRFPDSLITLSTYAFAYCTGIEYILLPASDITISDYNFSQSENLETVEYAEGCTRPYTVSTWLLGNTFTDYVKKLILPSTVTSLKTGTTGDESNDYFIFFTNLEEIEISEDNETYASYDGCIYSRDLSTLYIVPKAVDSVEISPDCTTIAAGSFAACANITEIEIPDTVTQIEGGVTSSRSVCGPFYACTSLERLVIPETVTITNDTILADYPNLVDLSLYLDGVYYHFTGETVGGGLDTLEIEDTDTAKAEEVTDAVFDLFDTEDVMHTYYGSATKDLDEIEDMLTEIILPAGTTSIQSDFFEDLTVLTAITVAEDNEVYTSVGGVLYAYADGEAGDGAALTLVRWPMALGYTAFADNVTSIGERAFYYCTGLSAIEFPATLTEVGAEAFRGCTDVAYDFSYSTGLTTIGDMAFYQARNSTVTLTDSVTSIGEDAFYTIDDSLTLYCPEGSYAQTYAEENGIACETYEAEGSADADADDSPDDSTDTDADDAESGSDDTGTDMEDAESGTEETGTDAADTESGTEETGTDAADTESGTEETGTNAAGSASGTVSSGSDTAAGGPVSSGSGIGTKVTVGNAVYKVTSETTVTYVKSAKKNAARVTIPATVKISGKTYKVTAVSASAFANNKKLKTVVFGKNVTSIGKKAFYNCKNLKKITFKGKKVKTIGSKAVKGIAKKAAVTVPKAKKSAYKKLLKKAGLPSGANVKQAG